MSDVDGGALAVLLPGFAGTELPGWLAGRLRDGLAGVCLFGENVASPAQLRELTGAVRDANPGAVVAIDEEGGDVTRLYYDRGAPYPGAAVLGRCDDVGMTTAVAGAVAADLSAVGVTLDLAPGADVNSNPDNPVIGVRSFGADPQLVARHVAAWVGGLQAGGVAACAKHFPGHGDTVTDSHLALPSVASEAAALRRRELVPFAAAVAAGVKAIMTSHLLLPAIDQDSCATFSPVILQGLLREELGFAGVVVSDALDMAGASGGIGIPEGAVRAVRAGCDLLCLGTRTTAAQLDEITVALAAAVRADRLSAARLGEATTRVGSLAAGGPAVSGAGAAVQPMPLSAVVEAFDVAPGIAVRDLRHVVALCPTANAAVGTVPWGPLTDGWRPAQVLLGPAPLHPPAPGAQVVVVGRDNHRHGWVRDLIDGARTSFADVVVVDMGWPSPDRRYADVATFGASGLVSDALRWWLAGGRS